VGQPASTAHIISAVDAEKTTAPTGRTRLCPSRSVSRPWTTAKAALAMRYDADTAPASE
jgi:hypothetical protein